MSAVTKSTKPVAIIGLLSIIAGFVMIIAGGVIWGVVTSQLKAENITVSAVTDEDPGALAGKPVAGPFTAYAQANAINHHALASTGGRTYAELGADASAAEAAGASEEEVAEIRAQRTSIMNASFLRASLFTSVVSYGICALVIGLGVMFILVGWAFRRVAAASSTGTVIAAEEVVTV